MSLRTAAYSLSTSSAFSLAVDSRGTYEPTPLFATAAYCCVALLPPVSLADTIGVFGSETAEYVGSKVSAMSGIF